MTVNEGGPDPDLRVDATPAKRFFVSMLVRDIELLPAIVDLIDNSVDGAKRLRPEEAKDRLGGFEITIDLDSTRFVISDNCGGIDLDRARHYAFKFGRTEDLPGPPGEVGQFGVGMKRALFKLGSRFRVESRSESGRFLLPVDVEEWVADESPDWTFQFQEVDETSVSEGDHGTRIEVDQLHAWVSKEFDDPGFLTRLRAEIELREMLPLEQGLSIKIKGASLEPADLVLLSSAEFGPIFVEKVIPVDGSEMKMTLFAGLVRLTEDDDEEDLEAERFRSAGPAGWYMFCNDRLLLAQDKSRLTGWGEAAAAYHPQYRQFRGYVFLSGDPRFMPWTTTKTYVDEDSQVFRVAQTAMFDALQKAVTLMNRLKSERQQRPPEERPAVDAMKAANPVRLENLSPSPAFVVPKAPPKPPATVQWIRYSIDKDDFDRAAETIGADAPSEVGRTTFEYYFENEVPD